MRLNAIFISSLSSSNLHFLQKNVAFRRKARERMKMESETGASYFFAREPRLDGSRESRVRMWVPYKDESPNSFFSIAVFRCDD